MFSMLYTLKYAKMRVLLLLPKSEIKKNMGNEPINLICNFSFEIFLVIILIFEFSIFKNYCFTFIILAGP